MIVRADLPPVTKLVQAAHAACEAGRRIVPPDGDHPHFVVLSVPDEPALISEYHRIVSAGIPAVQFREEDLGGSVTAFAAGPVSGDDRKLFRKMHLLKEM